MSGTFMYGGHVPANGIRQHYLRYGGRGDPLVVVPGITSPAATWGFVADRLGQHYDTYVLDVRGRGLSTGGSYLDYGLDACARDVAEFASALSLGTFHLLGHSLGARIAARYAHHYGSALSACILADPPLSGPGRRPYVKALSFYLDAIEEAIAGRTDAEVVRRTYPSWTDAQLRTRAEWLHTCDVHAIAASHRGLQEEGIHEDLECIEVPALLVAAGRGGVITESDLSELATLAPAIQVAWMPTAGHMLPFDDLDGFLEVTIRFLRGLAGH